MYTYITTPHLDTFDQAPDLRGRGNPDRVREHDLVRIELLAKLGDVFRFDTALEGAAEGDADRDGRGQAGHAEDRLHLRQRLIQRHVAVALVERLGRREGAVDASERGRAQPLVALEVQYETRILRSLARCDRSDDLFGAGHLWNAVVADERGCLDARRPGRGEPVDELAADSRRQHVLLVLETITRADVADGDAHAS